jgi:sugar-specific transcriptional regulator TrmB
MALELLRKLGLTEGEVKVYSALLDLGPSSVNTIHENARMERRNIYDTLNKLIERGLVSYTIENKRRLFQITNPQKVMGYIEEKEQELNKIKKEMSNELPMMLKKFNAEKQEITAEIFRGKEGIKAVWEDMLNNDGNYWIGSGRYVPKQMPAFFSSWNKRRIKQKIGNFELARAELKGEARRFQSQFWETKFLPEEFSVNPVVICAYGDKVVNFLYGKELFAFMIESREITENYKRYHRYLWQKVAKRVR